MTRAAMISRFGIIKTSNCLALTSNILTDCQKSKTSPKRSLELIEATRQKKLKYTEMKKITIYFHTQRKQVNTVRKHFFEQQNL